MFGLTLIDLRFTIDYTYVPRKSTTTFFSVFVKELGIRKDKYGATHSVLLSGKIQNGQRHIKKSKIIAWILRF